MSFRDSDVAKKFSELDEIVRTVELVGEDNNAYRIEVRSTTSESQPFRCRAYKRVKFSGLTPVFPEQLRGATAVEVWVVVDNFPSSYGNTAEDALRSAMHFLADLIAKKVGR